MATFFKIFFQVALVTIFALPAFGQMSVATHTAYSGMITTTSISLTEVATLKITEDRLGKGNCTITYAEGDIPPHKIETILSLEGLCAKYNRAQKVAGELAKEFNITHYQALKVALESGMGWGSRYQRAPIDGLEFEAEKIARRYLRAKKEIKKKEMKRRLIRDALKSRR